MTEAAEQLTGIGAQLREYRKRANLSQEALAERAGLAAAAISALERGVRRHPYPHTIAALAAALGLSAAESAALTAAARPARAAPSDGAVRSAGADEVPPPAAPGSVPPAPPATPTVVEGGLGHCGAPPPDAGSNR